MFFGVENRHLSNKSFPFALLPVFLFLIFPLIIFILIHYNESSLIWQQLCQIPLDTTILNYFLIFDHLLTLYPSLGQLGAAFLSVLLSLDGFISRLLHISRVA
jgi:hypothetical protein